MRVIRDIKDCPIIASSCVAIGVFDGVHRAHRAIIVAAIRAAGRVKASSVVITFWPHPRREPSLYSLEHRLRLLEELGVDYCIVVRFSGSFAKLGPGDFVSKILCSKLRARAVYVGENFRFGRGAKAGAPDLADFLRPCQAMVKVFKTMKSGGNAISSSLIRRLIQKGDISSAGKLLLRPVSVYGNVVAGTGRGRKLGFPTANISLHHEITPPSGVYAVRVLLGREKIFKGICYIGTRPTFFASNDLKEIEVHIFGFKKNIYGSYIEAQFIKKIRDQKTFKNAGLLISQIKKDISAAEKILA